MNKWEIELKGRIKLNYALGFAPTAGTVETKKIHGTLPVKSTHSVVLYQEHVLP